MTCVAAVMLHGCAAWQDADEREASVGGPCSELATGVNGSYGGETWIPGAAGAVAFEVDRSVAAYGRLALRATHDFASRDESIDLERKANWAEGNVRAGTLPFTFEDAPGFLLGAEIAVEYADNTPASVERELHVFAAAAAHHQRGDTAIGAKLGFHVTSSELDDDLPAVNNVPRDATSWTTRGLATTATVLHAIDANWTVVATGRLLLDGKWQVAEGAVGAGVDLLVAKSGSCRQYLRLVAEHHRSDPDDDRGALPFHHDGFVRVELVVTFGGRSPRSYGF